LFFFSKNARFCYLLAFGFPAAGAAAGKRNTKGYKVLVFYKKRAVVATYFCPFFPGAGLGLGLGLYVRTKEINNKGGRANHARVASLLLDLQLIVSKNYIARKRQCK
jgi:hypothetical protein